jgi:hypothetical protein
MYIHPTFHNQSINSIMQALTFSLNTLTHFEHPQCICCRKKPKLCPRFIYIVPPTVQVLWWWRNQFFDPQCGGQGLTSEIILFKFLSCERRVHITRRSKYRRTHPASLAFLYFRYGMFYCILAMLWNEIKKNRLLRWFIWLYRYTDLSTK